MLKKGWTKAILINKLFMAMVFLSGQFCMYMKYDLLIV
jgi:hypothetical protein